MARRQVISCPWQDEQGNVLALGSIVFEASGDALVTGTGELCAGIKGSLSLDSGGTVAASPAQYMWPTDQMSPSNITYTVWVYSANGQLAWGPNYGLTVPSGAGSFNLCTWVPNQIGAGSGAAAGSLTLQVEGVNNAVQSLLNLTSSDSSVTITDEGNGSVNFQVAGSGGSNLPLFLRYLTVVSGANLQGASANVVYLLPFEIDAPLNVGNMGFYVTADDGGAATYDVGIYDSTGTLIADVGPAMYSATGAVTDAFVQGSITIPAGIYFFALTGTNVHLEVAASFGGTSTVFVPFTTATPSVSGQLPSTIVIVQGSARAASNSLDFSPVFILY